MPRYVRPLDNRLLPPLHLDWSKSVAHLLATAAAQLTENGLLLELMVEAESPQGTALIPIVCDIGSQGWVPYIEAEHWDDEVTSKFVDWLSLIRTSTFSDVNIQFCSRYAVPEIVLSLARNTGIARLQLQAHDSTVPFEFAANARLLQALAKLHLQVDLALDDGAISKLDELIGDNLGPDGPLVATQALVHLVGCFLGEVLVTRHGGSWHRNGRGWHVQPHDVEPLEAAVQRFARGDRAPLIVHLPD